MTLSSPPGTEATVGVPRGAIDSSSSIAINGSTVWRDGRALDLPAGAASAGQDDETIKFTLKSGEWRIEVM